MIHGRDKPDFRLGFKNKDSKPFVITKIHRALGSTGEDETVASRLWHEP